MTEFIINLFIAFGIGVLLGIAAGVFVIVLGAVFRRG
jgi:hypothetical protein